MDTSESNRLKACGNDCFRGKDFEQAKVLYSLALSIDPINPILYANRSACNLALHCYQEAETDARMSLAIDHTSSKIYYRLAMALKLQFKIIDALEVVDLGLNVENNSILRNLRSECIRELYTSETCPNGSTTGSKSYESTQSNISDTTKLLSKAKCSRCATSPNSHCLQCNRSNIAAVDIEQRIQVRVDEILISLKCGTFKVPQLQHTFSDKQSILKQLLNPRQFKTLIYPGVSDDDAVYLPTSLKELLEWPSLRIDPLCICSSAVDVYNGVIKRGKALGQVVDHTTQVMLINEISQEAVARSIIEASREVCRLVNAVHARMASPVASPPSQIGSPQLDDDVVEQLIESGISVQDEFLGSRWSGLILTDVERYSTNEIMYPSIIEGVDHYNDSSIRPTFSWLDPAKLLTHYPALHSALAQIYQLPFEINDKSNMIYEILEVGKGCSMLIHYPVSSYQNSRLDSAVNAQNKRFHNSFRISCSYNIIPSAATTCSADSDESHAVAESAGPQAASFIYYKLFESESKDIPINHDQLIMHLSRDVKNSRLAAVEDYYSIVVFMHGKK